MIQQKYDHTFMQVLRLGGLGKQTQSPPKKRWVQIPDVTLVRIPVVTLPGHVPLTTQNNESFYIIKTLEICYNLQFTGPNPTTLFKVETNQID